MFSKKQMSPLELSFCSSWHVFSYNFAEFLLLKRVKCPPFFVFTTKTTQPRPQVFSVNGALTCRRLHFWRHFFVKHKILPNLVISNWFWWIMRVLLANQNRGNIWMNNNNVYAVTFACKANKESLCVTCVLCCFAGHCLSSISPRRPGQITAWETSCRCCRQLSFEDRLSGNCWG